MLALRHPLVKLRAVICDQGQSDFDGSGDGGSELHPHAPISL
jgi:hypothetical protein